MSTIAPINSGLVNLDTFLSLKKPINSPRSLEACLRQGLDVSELYEKSVEDFVKLGKSEHIAQMMYDHYEMRRAEKIKAVRGERKMIIEYLEQLKFNALSEKLPSPKNSSSPSSKSSKGKKKKKGAKGLQKVISNDAQSVSSASSGVVDTQGATMMEQEKKRLELMRKRQAKEIEQMMGFELKMAKIAEDNAKKLALEQKRKEENEALKEKNRMEALERKRKDELRKLAEEEQENRRRQELASKAFAEEMKLAEMEKLKAAEMVKLSREREMQRLGKQEALRRATDAKLKAIEMKAIAKMKEMEEAEIIRQKKREAKQKAHARVLAEKRLKAEKRIADALHQQNMILEKKRTDYQAKQQANSLRRHELEERDRLEALEKKDALLQEEKKRKRIFDDAKRREADRIQSILDDEERKSKGMERVYAKRAAKMEVKEALEEMKKKDKLENITRHARILEFQRLQTLQKISKDNERTEYIQVQKEQLITQRKKNQIAAMKRKHDIKFAMEKVRITKKWDDINDVVGSTGKKKSKQRMNPEDDE